VVAVPAYPDHEAAQEMVHQATTRHPAKLKHWRGVCNIVTRRLGPRARAEKRWDTGVSSAFFRMIQVHMTRAYPSTTLLAPTLR